MCPRQYPERNRPNDDALAEYDRRHILAAAAGLGVTMLAGCSTETGLSDLDGGSSSSGDADSAGTFRLLISDQPVAIDDFDRLDVSFDRARIFRGEGTDDAETEETESEETETEDDEPETETEGEDSESETESEKSDGDPDDDDQRGFFDIGLGGATVDLTQVVGDKAINVFEGELEEGRYTKIELYATDVEGIVDGDPVEVMIPSGKLQIVKPFDVVSGETLSFVFDINVVKKGQTGEYNLLPVISESGVAGQDVEVEEVGNGNPDSEGSDGSDSEADETEETQEEEPEESEDDESEDGRGDDEEESPPDEAGEDP